MTEEDKGKAFPLWAKIGAEVVCIRSQPWSERVEKPGPLPLFMRTYVIIGRSRSPSGYPGICLAGVAKWAYRLKFFAPVQKIEQEAQAQREKETVE